MHFGRLLHALVPAALLAAPALSQTFVPLALEGDVVPGVGTVTDVDLVTLQSNHDWIVEVKTDNPDPDKDRVALRKGYAYLTEGDPVSAPAGAVIKALDSYDFVPLGGLVTNYTLGGSVGPNDFEGVYISNALVVQRGAPAVAAGFSPGTTWGNFADVQATQPMVSPIVQLLVRGYVDDPAVPGTTDFYAAVLDVDVIGTLLGTTVIAKEGDVPPGQTDTINTIRTGAWSGRIENGFGGPPSTVFWSCDLNGSDTSDACVYRWSASSGLSTLVAQEGSPSPVPGRNWGSLISPEIDLNPAGDWTLKDTLDGAASTDGIILKNGVKFVQEGDTHPDIAPFVFNELGNGPAKLTSSGQVLWFGGWNDSAPLAYREALFLDQTMIVREGQTMINGMLLEDIEQQNDSYTITADGKNVIFIGTLAGGIEGAFLLALDDITSYCTAKVNSAGCVPVTYTAGTPSASAGSGFLIWADDLVPNQVGIHFYGTSGQTAQPFSGAWLCVQPPTTRLPAMNSGGSLGCSGLMTVDFNAYVAQGLDPALVAGAQVNGQFWSRDTGLPPPFQTGLTGGVQFELQP